MVLHVQRMSDDSQVVKLDAKHYQISWTSTKTLDGSRYIGNEEDRKHIDWSGTCSEPVCSTALLKQLHWLLFEWCIQFKSASLKTLHTVCLPYLTDHLQHHQPTQSLHSSSSHQIFILRHHLDRVLSASQPNGSVIPCLSAFTNCSRSLLLNVISRLNFSTQLIPPANVPWFYNSLWCYVNVLRTHLYADMRWHHRQ